MKQLPTLTLFILLAGCTGCESTPPSTELPFSPPTKPLRKTQPAEPAAKFAVGDKVLIDINTRVIRGVILSVGPVGVWEHFTTGEERISRAYQLRLTDLDSDKTWIGILPEFALIRERKFNERRK